MEDKKNILILGISGMLGSTLFRTISSYENYEVYGSVRSNLAIKKFNKKLHGKIISDINLSDETHIMKVFSISKPDIVINCVGIIKQLPLSDDYLESLSINSVLPHKIAKYCHDHNSRLIHFSTDCVFSGDKGNYYEIDIPDSKDLYGRSKLLGEVQDEDCITLRTSIIGHELGTQISLLEWFLNQQKKVKGYRGAIFSGLPTIEVANVLTKYVIPNPKLKGLYHLSVDPINKFELLKLISEVYQKNIEIIPFDDIRIDRSLNSDRFKNATGYKPKNWPELIKEMRLDFLERKTTFNL